MLIIRIIFVILCGLSGLLVSFKFGLDHAAIAAVGIAAGLVVALVEMLLGRASAADIAAGAIGVAAGLLAAMAFNLAILNVPHAVHRAGAFFPLFSCMVFSYLGASLMVRYKKSIPFINALDVKSGEGIPKILDTSVIIDGRIADIVEAGFIEGELIVPRFVLNELQHIADSADSIKRTRGRRGLEVLDRVKKGYPNVTILDADSRKFEEVDARLVTLAREINAKVVTNDFNLNKIAKLQGVKVLNINELSNAVKSVMLSGEIVKVRVIKEGKDPGQGVGYLDDGTMIVVDNGRESVGRELEVEVTSTLQTAAGRMIFARKKG